MSDSRTTYEIPRNLSVLLDGCADDWPSETDVLHAVTRLAVAVRNGSRAGRLEQLDEALDDIAVVLDGATDDLDERMAVNDRTRYDITAALQEVNLCLDAVAAPVFEGDEESFVGGILTYVAATRLRAAWYCDRLHDARRRYSSARRSPDRRVQ